MGKWRGPATNPDRLLGTKEATWFRKHCKANRLPCALCGHEINYDVKRYADGSFHPRSFVLGHVIGRALGRSLGYSDAQLNEISNMRPECRECSNKHGARAGYLAQQVAKQRAKANRPGVTTVKPKPTKPYGWVTSTRW